MVYNEPGFTPTPQVKQELCLSHLDEIVKLKEEIESMVEKVGKMKELEEEKSALEERNKILNQENEDQATKIEECEKFSEQAYVELLK